jgi:hypothetical protein
MRVCSTIVVMLAALSLFGCAAKQEAKAPETNPWAEYKGTWAPGGSQTIDEEPKPAKVAKKSEESKPEKAEKPEKADKPAKAEKADKPEPKPVKVAAAESKPAKIADPKPTAKGGGDLKPDDARSMYGVEVSQKAEEPAEETAAPAKTPKKRGGKKGGKKGAHAKR